MPIAGLLYAVAQFQTNAGLSLIFIRQRAFKLFIGGLLIARGPRCHFVLDEGLIEIERLSREQGIFHTCTISVHTASPKYAARRCPRTTRSTSGERTLLVCRLAVTVWPIHTCIGQMKCCTP